MWFVNIGPGSWPARRGGSCYWVTPVLYHCGVGWHRNSVSWHRSRSACLLATAVVSVSGKLSLPAYQHSTTRVNRFKAVFSARRVTRDVWTRCCFRYCACATDVGASICYCWNQIGTKILMGEVDTQEEEISSMKDGNLFGRDDNDILKKQRFSTSRRKTRWWCLSMVFLWKAWCERLWKPFLVGCDVS